VHCIRQYSVGKELTSKREVMNLIELFAADWPVLLISVNKKSLKELGLVGKFWLLLSMAQF
jgi:hypothetical protein